MKVVIFGATGSIGVYASTLLKQKGFDVVAVGHRVTDNGFFAEYSIPYYSMDISDVTAFKSLPHDGDAVIHLAGAMPAHMKDYNPEMYMDSIVKGTFHILDYMKDSNCSKILFSQSIADVLYRFGSTVPIPDNAEMKFPPNTDHSVYSICKNASVNLIEHYYHKYHFQRFILRLPTIYGYHPNPYYYVDGVKRWLGYRYLIEQAIKGETLEIWGNPKAIKEMVCIKDLVQLMEKCLLSESEGGIYNVGCGCPVTIEEQINTIAEVFNRKKKSKIIYCPQKPSSPQFILDISKAVNELGYCPSYGIRALFEDYKYYLETEPFAKLMGKRSSYVE